MHHTPILKREPECHTSSECRFSVPVTMQLSLALSDPDLNSDELEVLTQTLHRQLYDLADDVERVPIQTMSPTGSLVQKGDETQPGLLQMEVNLDSVRKLAAWLWQRLAGRSTKATLKFGEGSRAVEFSFEGNSQTDLAATLEDATGFIERIMQLQTEQQTSQPLLETDT